MASHALPLRRISDRSGFKYLEHCRLGVHDGAVVAESDETVAVIPVGALAALMLGEGSSVSQAAVIAATRAGCCLFWATHGGLRCVAFGLPVLHATNELATRQAQAWTQRRLEVAVRLFERRFGEAPKVRSVAELLGIEGSAAKERYRVAAGEKGLQWYGRVNNAGSGVDGPNRAVSLVSSVVNCLVCAVVVQMGLIPSLGFLHNGQPLAFVYDLADLYRFEITVPVGFELAARGFADSAWRESYHEIGHRLDASSFLQRVSEDVQWLVGDL